MKKITFIAAILAAAMAITLIAAGCSGSKPAAKPETTAAAAVQAVQYTCPMHPEVISDKPGKCPKCGMDLVVKK